MLVSVISFFQTPSNMHFKQPPATGMPTFSRQIAGSPTYRATLTENYQGEAMIGMPQGNLRGYGTTRALACSAEDATALFLRA